MTAEGAMRQAHMTALEYLIHGRQDIDTVFGAGFARSNPGLVAAYMQVAATDFQSWLYSERSESASLVTDALRAIATAIEGS